MINFSITTSSNSFKGFSFELPFKDLDFFPFFEGGFLTCWAEIFSITIVLVFSVEDEVDWRGWDVTGLGLCKWVELEWEKCEYGKNVVLGDFIDW